MTEPLTNEKFTIPPTEATVAEIAKLTVYDSQGKTTDFGRLIQDQKAIVVFIRE